MTLALLTSRSIRPSLLVLGVVVAPLLAGLGVFGLGDAELTARAQLERDARARIGGLQALWSERVAGEAPVAKSAGEMMVLDQDRWQPAPLPLAATSDEERSAASLARLLLLGARADFSAEETVRAMAQCRRVIATSDVAAGEALVLLVQIARLSDPDSVSGLFLEAKEAVPHRSAIDGTSGRLLALLTAAPALDAETRDASAVALGRTLEENRASLPTPAGDRIELTDAGWQFQPDPWWAALQEACSERLGDAQVDWATAFRELPRRSAALERFLEARFPDRENGQDSGEWRLNEDGDRFVAFRRDEAGPTRVALHTAAALDQALQSLLPEGDDFAARAFSSADQSPGLVPPVALAGTPLLLHLTARPGNETIRSVAFRIRALRAGLLIVSVLLALAALAAWRTLAREARLRDLRSTFVASVSHDLRTPVASISLLASNLASGYASGSESKYLDSIQGEAARLRRLVDDLLDFGRLERGLPPRIQREPVELTPWLESFTEKERVRCHAFGCALDLVTESLPGEAHLDAPALERGLSNLIDNAIKHGRAAGATLRVRGDGPMLVFEVEDTGTGLSAAALRADLFQPFERGSAKSAGTGLGLSIVRAIAEGHGGTARVRPGREGVGAIATLEVPVNGGRAA